ncbi:MAG: HIT family protein, partial [Candidatus Aenigmatarchaeota archaeon]
SMDIIQMSITFCAKLLIGDNMKKCVFCQIVSGEIKCHRIYEDRKHIAFLDINPNTEGMAIVITKKHFDSYIFDMPQKDYQELFKAVRKVIKGLDRALKVKRTAIVMEGMGINHVHVKLYPLHGIDKKFVEMWAKKKVYMKKYNGFITTQLGPRADDKTLAALASKIRKSMR